MKTIHLNLLLAGTCLAWFIPWQGKQWYPTVFGSSYIQWTSAIITALLLSLGMFLSIRTLFSHPKQRRSTGWICVGFVIIFSINLGLHGLISPMVVRVNSLLADSSANIMLMLMQNLQEAETEKSRQRYAQAIYTFSGFAMPYQTEDNGYVVYQPTEKDKELWARNQVSDNNITETKEMLDWQLKQLPYIASLYIGSFFIMFTVGILTFTYQKNKRKDADDRLAPVPN